MSRGCCSHTVKYNTAVKMNGSQRPATMRMTLSNRKLTEKKVPEDYIHHDAFFKVENKNRYIVWKRICVTKISQIKNE